MVGRSVVAALYIGLLFSLAACGASKPAEPIDPARVAANRALLEKCRKITPCVGGFMKSRADKEILRIVRGEPREFFVIGLTRLLNYSGFYGDEWFNQVEFVLHDNPEWGKTAIAYEEQFVEAK